MENEPGFLFDALVLEDGEKGVAVLSKDGNTIDFIKNQYRHCNPIMAIGAAKSLLDTAEVFLKLRLSICLACPTSAKCKNPICDLMRGPQARTQQKKMACFEVVSAGQTGTIVITTDIDSFPPPRRTPLAGGQAL